jgi:multiple sugar transport system permease protein
MKSKYTSLIFLFPSILLLVIIGIIPLFPVIWESLHFHIVATPTPPFFIGLSNFRKIVTEPEIGYYFGITFLLAVLVLLIEVPLGLGIALLLVRKFRGREVFQTLFALPLGIAPIAVGCIWVLVLRPEIGPLTRLLNLIGIDFNYMASFWTAFTAILLMNIWRWTPFVTLTLLPALVSLPPDILEASKIDGATFWKTLRYVVLPMIKIPIITVIFIRLMDTLMVFDEVWVLTGGGPGWSTRFISIDIVRRVIFETDYGFASALSLVTLYMTISISWVMLAIMKRGRLMEVS